MAHLHFFQFQLLTSFLKRLQFSEVCMHLGRSFHSTELLYLKLFLPYVIVLNDNKVSLKFEKVSTALELTDRLITALDNHNTPLNIFIDLSKAFDTLDHTILLDKLLYYGIRSTAYNLLRSYLTNREQFVELNDTASKALSIITGVPQGSILGPLLFLIYINDFPLSSNFFQFIMYADDTTLYSQFDNARIANHDIELEINNELTNINDWLKIIKLALNIKN